VYEEIAVDVTGKYEQIHLIAFKKKVLAFFFNP